LYESSDCLDYPIARIKRSRQLWPNPNPHVKKDHFSGKDYFSPI